MVLAKDRVFSIGGWNDTFDATSDIYYSNKIASTPTELPTSLPSPMPTTRPVTIVSSTTTYVNTRTTIDYNSSNSSQASLNLSSSVTANVSSSNGSASTSIFVTGEQPFASNILTTRFNVTGIGTKDPENSSKKPNQELIVLVIALSVVILLLCICICVGLMYFCRYKRGLMLRVNNANVVDFDLRNKSGHEKRNQGLRNSDIKLATVPVMNTGEFDNDVGGARQCKW